MNSKTKNTPRRVAINGLIVLALLVAAAANVSPALAATAPVNDDFLKAIKISTTSYGQSVSDITVATSDTNGTFDPPLTCDGGGIGEVSVWYAFTPLSGGELTLSTSGSGYDTIITVFKAAYDTSIPGYDTSSLIELGCNDDATLATLTSALIIPLRGGTRYYIEVVRKSGAAVSAPDPLKFTAKWAAKVYATPGLWETTQAPPFKYTPVGWLLYPIPPGIAHLNNVGVANNPGDAATFFYDGDPIEVCYVLGPEMGTLNIYIDGVFVGARNQGNATYMYQCDTFWYAGPYYLDNLHKVVLQHGGPAGKKVNIDTIEVFPHADFWDPDPIFDLGPKPGTPPTGKIILQWTATGDDGMYGRANHYEVRYISDADWVANGSNDPWDQATWDAASPISVGLPNPLVSGGLQYMTISGLAPGVVYHFNVVGYDEAGNPLFPGFSNDYSASVTGWASGVYGPGWYDDRFGGMKFSGKWNNVTSPDNYKDTLRIATKVDSAVQFTFTGTQFRYMYNTAYNFGLADLYLDGVYFTTIDQYTPIPLRWTYVSPMLSYGPHTLRIVMTTLKYISIDAIYIAGITDGGPPDPITDLAAVSGATDGSVDLTWTATGDDPGGVGTAAQYEVRYSTSPILTEFDWLAADIAPGLVPVPGAAGNPESMTVTNLVPGVVYWFAVRATDDAAYGVLSNTTSATAAVVSYVYSPAGFYEDSDVSGPSWIYYGAWSTPTYLSGPSNLDQHTTNNSGSSAVFLFNGDGFTLTFQKGYGFGSLKVYVDGVFVGQINQKNGTTLWQQTWTYSGLGGGNHTVQFVSTGKTSIDAIEVLP